MRGRWRGHIIPAQGYTQAPHAGCWFSFNMLPNCLSSAAFIMISDLEMLIKTREWIHQEPSKVSDK